MSDATHVDASDSASLLVKQMRDAQRQAGALVRLIKTSTDFTEEQRAAITNDLKVFVDAEIPSARALYRASLAGGLETETIYLLWRRAKQSFMACGPAVIDMFLAKMENEKLPHSERLLVEAMKGMGFLVPSAPVDDAKRKDEITVSEVKKMSDKELREQLESGLRDDGAGGEDE